MRVGLGLGWLYLGLADVLVRRLKGTHALEIAAHVYETMTTALEAV